MNRAQVGVLVLMTAIVAVAVGFAAARQSRPTPANDPPKKAKAAIAASKPTPDIVDPVIPTAKPADGVDTPKAPAKVTSPKLPSGLSEKLKLNEDQRKGVDQILKDWNGKLGDLNNLRQEALTKAREATDPAVRRQQETAAMDEWRTAFTSAKQDRSAAMQGLLDAEQAAAYREYRDQQYGSWLTQQASIHSSVARASLKLTPEQTKDVEGFVRGTIDEITMGGMSVPLDTQRTVAEQVLQQRIRSVLTAPQVEKFDLMKHAISLR